MEISVGIVLALAMCAMAAAISFDRATFYPAVLIAVAGYYVVFAASARDTPSLIKDTSIAAVFVATALVGFRRSAWIVVGGLAAHGVLDLVHHRIIANPGVPEWWPAFCMAFDLTAAGYLASRLYAKPRQAGAGDNA